MFGKQYADVWKSEFHKYTAATRYKVKGILVSTSSNAKDYGANHDDNMKTNEGQSQPNAQGIVHIVRISAKEMRHAFMSKFANFGYVAAHIVTNNRSIGFDLESYVHGAYRIVLHELRHLYDNQNLHLNVFKDRAADHPDAKPETDTYGKAIEEFEADRSAVEASLDKRVLQHLKTLFDTIRADMEKKGMLK